MKKLFTILFCLFALMASADDVKLALLQPRVAEGSDPCRPIELNMVRGELRKAFGWQSDFQVLTRTDVDAMLKEHGFQRTGMVDENQRKEIGKMTSAQYICVSTITKDGSQLYIESYLVDIETGVMTNPATQFANVQNGDYSTLQEPCNQLAKEMLGELGEKPHKSGKIGVASTKKSAEGYVDLGLPSGTLWKAENEDCGLITYDQAYNFYGNSLPTKEQWAELKSNCLWTWTGNGYKVKGKSGESIFLPAAGYRYCDGSTGSGGSCGYYWSSTPDGSEDAWYLYFHSGGVGMNSRRRCGGLSVRLVR